MGKYAHKEDRLTSLNLLKTIGESITIAIDKPTLDFHFAVNTERKELRKTAT